ncbi:diguanylate cyclase [Cognatiyoonia sp. IB215182]|uniref:diguanylate cyclase n=1 Tax=Cognatiyoonia sp. IB215182 TaxID=3097353 RepID=UPI002A0EAB18|nr:diguanylate cyclase [Cognatiyoonia sp. IB215182]MDX8351012.1 diguanylate cyclase [Cognatiyoonia sp. IB215182]
MSGRILIIDTVATNRIVLKVKMLSAQFSVDACSSRIEAEAIIATNRPDLILINLSDPVEDRHAFCQALRQDPQTASIAIIAVGVADTSRARFAALDAGADDVLPRPMNDTLLMARIRSLLRVRSATEELMLRDGTSRALGFEEARASFETAANVALLAPIETDHPRFRTILQAGLSVPVRVLDTNAVLRTANVQPIPDLFVIDATQVETQQAKLFGLVSDLRSRTETRLSTLLIIVPDGMPEVAAMFLDLGADDIVVAITSEGELTLRAKALVRRKLLHDRLRDTVRDGLQAAVTDPLTGLYNRRYAEPHLARMADQARKADRDFAVMMMDIDHFKSINDTYGHAAGDRVLVQLAERLRENLRTIDLVARVGGEEFLVALPRTTTAQAHATANRLRRLVNCRPFDLGEEEPELRVTVSVGVAVSHQNGLPEEEPRAVCDKADAALYAAKSAGRDQVAMSRSAA